MATIGVEGRRTEVEDGKRLVLAIEEDLGIDRVRLSRSDYAARGMTPSA